eukprot:Unigene13699_Nuclearia_a/m.41422 Unigene13699_Nuclearia_a/g.41422  ORF Unigene13699_Nuclearia_a/g.41422 Unigene13699_Nuclearia_a/m.41422 type:complete len:121 (-) Unigene13699_Nuclearia_a:90-452(-)
MPVSTSPRTRTTYCATRPRRSASASTASRPCGTLRSRVGRPRPTRALARSGDVMLDDRDAYTTIGQRFREATLTGFPFIIIVGRNFAADGKYELQERRTGVKLLLTLDETVTHIRSAVLS